MQLQINKQEIKTLMEEAYAYYADTKDIKSKILSPKKGMLFAAPSFDLAASFIQPDWSGRTIAAKWNDKTKQLENLVITERKKNWIKNKYNIGGYLYKFDSDDLKFKHYTNGTNGDSGMDMYFDKPKKYLEKIHIPNILNQLKKDKVKIIYKD